MTAEAEGGARYVLGRLQPRRQGYCATVTVIVDSTVDTNKGDVKLAAALAMCEALGVQLEPPPRLDASGLFFPTG